MQSIYLIVALVSAYLIGSLSFAVIVSRVFGLADPRGYGSKNPGATNVLRSGNKPAALLTLAFDVLKGYVPVLLVLVYGPRFGLGESAAAFAGLAAFVGHLWPVFFRFRGELRSAHQAERGGLIMTMEGFHPVAEARAETAGSLVPFLRRTPDPVIQLTRLAVLEQARRGSGGTTKYVDPSTVDVAALLAAPPDRSLHERISEANHRTVMRETVARLEELLLDIRRDRDVSYARVLGDLVDQRQEP